MASIPAGLELVGSEQNGCAAHAGNFVPAEALRDMLGDCKHLFEKAIDNTIPPAYKENSDI
jgi:hypothetical protein